MRMKYVYYLPSGEIKRVMETDEETALLNIGDGELMLAFDLLEYISANEHYIKNGALVEYPSKPEPWSAFNFETETWYDPRTPEQIEEYTGEMRRTAIQRVNRAVDAVRRRYITDIIGQDMLYMEKRHEAAAYLTANDPDPSNYPLLSAEIGITAPTLYEIAQIYLGLASIWVAMAAQLETVRLGAIATIETTNDVSVMDQTATAACNLLAQYNG